MNLPYIPQEIKTRCSYGSLHFLLSFAHGIKNSPVPGLMMSRLIFCQKAYLGVLVLRSLEPLTIKQLNQVPLLVTSLPAGDSVGDDGEPDEVDCD
jgi:hypothetical protein